MKPRYLNFGTLNMERINKLEGSMKFIDLFAGVGGFHYGLTRANNISGHQTRKQKTKREGMEAGRNIYPGQSSDSGYSCVYSNEWDKYANSVYRRHFGTCDQSDIRTVDADGLPDFDILCGGFPCQSFSIAGKRRGFADTRGTLFFEICRILRAKRPRLVLLENVKGLLSHDSGKTFYTIIQSLDELGYDCQWQVCNSKDFGVPQNRERIFIVGHTRGTPRPEVFPLIGNDSQTALGPVTASAGRNRATGSNYVTEVQSGKVNKGKFVGRKDESLALTSSYWKGHDNHGARTMIGQAMRVGSVDKPSVTLKGLGGGMGAKTGLYETEHMKIRRLTPVECERLQAFPDNWTKYGADGELISDTQRYKMMGNAVTTSVITAIAERLL